MRPSDLLVVNFILSIIFLVALVSVEVSGYEPNIFDYLTAYIVCMFCGLLLHRAFLDRNSESALQMFWYPITHLAGAIVVVKVLDIFQAEGGFWGNVALAIAYGMFVLLLTPSGPEGGYHPRPGLAVMVGEDGEVRHTETNFSYDEGDYAAIGLPFFGVFIGLVKGYMQMREIDKKLKKSE